MVVDTFAAHTHPTTMEHLSDAMPANPEQWVAALTTLILAIIGFLRKLKKTPPEQ